eukprot:668901-Amphidinium_carterae.1
MEKVRAQVAADMKAGFAGRVDKAVAGRVLGGDPVLVRLGAVPKGDTQVQVVFDGSHGSRVNRHIK